MKLHKIREALDAANSNLAGSQFEDVNLGGATFTNINLSETVFTNVNLSGVSIRDANLKGMRIEGVLVSDLFAAYRLRAGAVVFAKDLARMSAFYGSVFGLKGVRAADDHVVLGGPSFRLVVHRIPEQLGASIRIEDPPLKRGEAAIKLVFEVASLAKTRELARKHGGELLPPDREWQDVEGRVCDGMDPEGNVLQCRERAGPAHDCPVH